MTPRATATARLRAAVNCYRTWSRCVLAKLR
jgi:hypothetical protein